MDCGCCQTFIINNCDCISCCDNDCGCDCDDDDCQPSIYNECNDFLSVGGNDDMFDVVGSNNNPNTDSLSVGGNDDMSGVVGTNDDESTNSLSVDGMDVATDVDENPPPLQNSVGHIEPLEVISLPISFYILSKYMFTVEGKYYWEKTKCPDIDVILTQVNVIWKVAGIQFVKSECDDIKTPPSSEEQKYITTIEQRDLPSEGSSVVPARYKAISGLTLGKASDVYDINVFVLSFLGHELGGLGAQGVNMFPGIVWLASLMPWNASITRPFTAPEMEDSMAKVLAHELGHVLSLGHNDIRGMLMHSLADDEGYKLSQNEIEAARKTATSMRKHPKSKQPNRKGRRKERLRFFV